MAESHREEIAKLEALYAGNPGGRVFVHLAEAYRKAGEHERARRILDEGLARHTDSASGFVVLGRVLADMQITAEAEAAFRRVLELDGGNLVALRWLGDLARQAGRSSEAATHYRELLVRNPSNEEVRDLVEIVERSAAGSPAHAGAAGADEEPLTDWAPQAEAPAEGSESAVAEPVSAFEERAVMPPETAEPAESDVSAWSAAPGQTGAVSEPPVEFGLVEIATQPDEDIRETGREAGALREPEQAYDSDVVADIEDEEGDLLELDELSRDDEAEPMEIHLLDPSYESVGADTEDLDVELDLMDLSRVGADEDEGDYASDEFLADLIATSPEEPEERATGVVDVLDGASPFTLLSDDAEDVPPAPVEEYAAESAEPIEPPMRAESMAMSEPAEFMELTEPESDDRAGTFETAPAELIDMDASDELLLVQEEEKEEVTDLDAYPIYVADQAAEAEEETFPPEPAEEPDVQIFAELAGASEPASESKAEPAVGPARPIGDAGLVTETMAVLYRSQGFHDRAAEVYRALLRQRPNDERLAARLRDAEQAAGEVAAPADEDETGEVWLRGVGTAWTGAQDTAPAEAATPYAWIGEPEEGEPGEPISAYLRDLVGWKAGQGRWTDNAPSGSPTPPRGPDGDATPPDWLIAAGAEESAIPWADAAAEEVASWSPTSQPVPDATDHGAPAPSGPRVPSGNGEAEEDVPADPWLHGPPAVEPEPAAAAPEEADRAHESWTPLDLDRAVPLAAASAAAPGVAAERAANTPPPAVSKSRSEDEDAAEDEDLEMFRSWLQSLKK